MEIFGGVPPKSLLCVLLDPTYVVSFHAVLATGMKHCNFSSLEADLYSSIGYLSCTAILALPKRIIPCRAGDLGCRDSQVYSRQSCTTF
jgi:hypothetical protein